MVRQAAPRGLGKHCHCCRQKRPGNQLIPCGASQGEGGAKHGPWCHRCILTKLHKDVAFIEEAAVAAKQGIWKCPRCDDVCPCNKCIQRRSKESKHRKPRAASSGLDDDGTCVQEHDAPGSPDHGEDSDKQSPKGSAPSQAYEESESYSSPEPSPRGSSVHSRTGLSYMEYHLPESEIREKPDHWDSPMADNSSADPVCNPRPSCFWSQHAPVHTVASSNQDWPEDEDESVKKPSRGGSKFAEGSRATGSVRTEEPAWSPPPVRRHLVGPTHGKPSGSGCGPSSAKKSLGRLLLQKIINAVVEEDVDVDGLQPVADARPHPCVEEEGSLPQTAAAAPGLVRNSSAKLSSCTVKNGRQPTKVDAEVSGRDCGPQTPSTLESGKGAVDSPGHSGSNFLQGLPVRKRLTRKGTPARGDAGVDIQTGPLEVPWAGHVEPLVQQQSPVYEQKAVGGGTYVASPDVSFESLERARGQDEDEGVVTSSPKCEASDLMVPSPEQLPGEPRQARLLVSQSQSHSQVLSPSCVRTGTKRMTAGLGDDNLVHSSVTHHRESDGERLEKIGKHASADLLPKKRPRTKRPPSGSLVMYRSLKVPRPAPAFSDDISYEAPSPSSDSHGSAGSEGCSRLPLSTRPAAPARRTYPTGSLKRAAGQGNRDWVPPVSPYGLIQEKLYTDPWKLLVACMLLNKTSGQQMYRVIWDLFDFIPTSQSALEARTEDIGDIIHSLGLHNKRGAMIQRFSREYLYSDWVSVSELHGIGKYAADAHAIFCEGRWQEVEPEDHMLRKYWEWLCATDGQGEGFLPE